MSSITIKRQKTLKKDLFRCWKVTNDCTSLTNIDTILGSNIHTLRLQSFQRIYQQVSWWPRPRCTTPGREFPSNTSRLVSQISPRATSVGKFYSWPSSWPWNRVHKRKVSDRSEAEGPLVADSSGVRVQTTGKWNEPFRYRELKDEETYCPHVAIKEGNSRHNRGTTGGGDIALINNVRLHRLKLGVRAGSVCSSWWLVGIVDVWTRRRNFDTDLYKDTIAKASYKSELTHPWTTFYQSPEWLISLQLMLHTVEQLPSWD